ncbi:MAG: hypothetical protein ACTSPK_00105 [Candidatus Heimdallarchaeota archaeon]
MADGIEVYLVRPDVIINQTLLDEFVADTITYQGGYVNPEGTPTNIKWFRFVFESETKPLKHTYDRIVTVNQGINTVPLRQVDHILTFSNAYIGNYRTSSFAEYFKKGLEYAISEWAKLPERFVQVVRFNAETEVESKIDWIWHYPSLAFIRYTGIIDGHKPSEDSFNNLFINSLQISWGYKP